jgi:hypothetical protein
MLIKSANQIGMLSEMVKCKSAGSILNPQQLFSSAPGALKIA